MLLPLLNDFAALMKYFKPRIIFLIYMTGVIIFIAASIGARGNAGLAMLNLCLFFESILFATFVSLGIRGVGKHTKVHPTSLEAIYSSANLLPESFWLHCCGCRWRCAFPMRFPYSMTYYLSFSCRRSANPRVLR